MFTLEIITVVYHVAHSFWW